MIRPYDPADLDAVLDVWERASAVGHPFLSREFLVQERCDIAELFLPRAETWVFESDGGIAGYVSVRDGEIGGLFVDPRLHRRGIGRALVRHVIELHRALDVEVFERNATGRGFYERLGFAIVGGHEDDATGLSMLRLRCSGAR